MDVVTVICFMLHIANHLGPAATAPDLTSKYYLPTMEYSNFYCSCGQRDFYYSYLLCVCSNN